ncbi:MAG: class I SAM-dependent methyltransferase [Gammaproteobacteria bacterium]|nr:MAG: class I SAM-dependent methyltransferase [Gammaproteobacteria bacterium]
MNLINMAENGWFPDPVIRMGIRKLCGERLKQCERRPVNPDALRPGQGRVAVATDEANQQHYELPPEFFQRVLGPHLKYSACLFERDDSTLADAERAMLELYLARAELDDGQRILELGCGWGSLSLFMAERLPNSHITAVSNSRSQKQFIDQRARERGLTNLTVLTRDVNTLELNGTFDRIVSVEMLEHVRDHAGLFARVRQWMAPDATFFIHIFCHDRFMYPFEDQGESDWMARHFFTGGVMPSFDIFSRTQAVLPVRQQWQVNGTHYARTARAWLNNMDAHADEIREIFNETYGRAQSGRWINRWRMFFMACEELFGYRDGKEWYVGHYLLSR